MFPNFRIKDLWIFSQLFFLEVEKILVGFKDLRNFYFSSNFPPFLGNLLNQNQGYLDFFSTIFCHPGYYQLDLRNFGFFWRLPLIIGNLVFQNQGIFDFFPSQQFFEVAISSILFRFKDIRNSWNFPWNSGIFFCGHLFDLIWIKDWRNSEIFQQK